MIARNFLIACSSLVLLAACGQQSGEGTAAAVSQSCVQLAVAEEAGLQIDIVKNGHGRCAVAGDHVAVHYTGWLYDESAADNRGEKFDSSVDRGKTFDFTLGEGRVIKGWDEGVAGMLIGEKRVLTIPPDMGYGDRGAGEVIPPGATLVFEVELFDAVSMSE